MFEKVNMHHPDKVADRVAGALVDIAYTRSEGGWAQSNPHIAVEVLIGHGEATVIVETDADIREQDVCDTVQRIAAIAPDHCRALIVPQDKHLNRNQADRPRCGDNGIFRGSPVTDEQRLLTALARTLAANFPSDGKYIIYQLFGTRGIDDDGEKFIRACDSGKEKMQNYKGLTICQSQATDDEIRECLYAFFSGKAKDMVYEVKAGEPLKDCDAIGAYLYQGTSYFYGNPNSINPLGPWTGGLDTDSGATNRKLGSDMGDAVTGGGLMGKDLSKADVSVNIVCHLLAQEHKRPVWASCAIGDEDVTFRMPDFSEAYGLHCYTLPFAEIMERARLYIMTQHGSFEHFAEWGLI